MVCAKEGAVVAVHFDLGDTCLHDEGSKDQIKLLFEWKKSSVKRWNSRYSLKSGGRSQGDHIFAISTFPLTLCHLFSNLSNEEARKKILQFFHPLLKKLHMFNRGYLDINYDNFKKIQGLREFGWNFSHHFRIVEEYANEMKVYIKQAIIFDYLENACFFYNNLPLLVYCEGPANPGTGEAKGNTALKQLKQKRQFEDNFHSLSDILPKIIDKNALSKLIERSREESYPMIIGDFIIQVLLISSSLVENSKWDGWLASHMSILLNGNSFKRLVLSFFDQPSFTDHYDQAIKKILSR